MISNGPCNVLPTFKLFTNAKISFLIIKENNVYGLFLIQHLNIAQIQLNAFKVEDSRAIKILECVCENWVQ